MTLPLEKIGDKGQRFLIEAHNWPKIGWCAVGYMENLEDAWKAAENVSKNPEVTQTRITDRHVRGVPYALRLPRVMVRQILYPISMDIEPYDEINDVPGISILAKAVRKYCAIVAWVDPNSGTMDQVKDTPLLGLKAIAVSHMLTGSFLVLYGDNQDRHIEAWRTWTRIAAVDDYAGRARNWIGFEPYQEHIDIVNEATKGLPILHRVSRDHWRNWLKR